MSRKGNRNQELQAGKAEKAYGGYLPDVMSEGDKDREELSARNEGKNESKLVNTPS